MFIEVKETDNVPEELTEKDEKSGKIVMKMIEQDGLDENDLNFIRAKKMLKIEKPCKCIALDENNKCTIYENRPQVCREYFCRHSFPSSEKERNEIIKDER